MASNPYAPPTQAPASPQVRHDGPSEFRRGPAWYIVFAGLAGGFAMVPFLVDQNAVALAMIPAGCVIGGFIFRIRSHQWPYDPTVRKRQLIYSALAIILPPTALFFLGGPYGQGPAIMMIGAIVGASVAGGIFASGTRRFRVSEDTEWPSSHEP